MQKNSRAVVWGIILLAAALSLFLSWQGFSAWMANGYYAATDSDPMMRYVRVLALAMTGDWYDNVIARDNYPFGLVLSWTRLFDLLILLPAYGVKLVMGFNWKDAIYWTGSWISPVFQILSVSTLVWAVKPLRVVPIVQLLLALLFVCNPILRSYFAFGRGDHHSLLVFLFILSLGTFLRLLVLPDRRRILGFAMTCALGLWASPEFMVMIFLSLAFLGVLWLRGNEKAVHTLCHLLGLLSALTALLILLEKPPAQFFLIEHDRVSIVHLALFLSGWAAAVLNAGFFLNRPLSFKAGAVVLETLILFSMLALLFPRFYLGPYAAFDVRVIPVWVSRLVEMESIINRQDILSSIVFMATFLLGIAGLSMQLKKHEQKPLYAFLLVLVASYGVLACAASRWSYYAETVNLIGCALILASFVQYLFFKAKPWAIACGFVTLYLLLTIILNLLPSGEQDRKNAEAHENYHTCIATLNRLLQTGQLSELIDLNKKHVFTHNGLSPMLMYWTNAYTVGSNFTHNVEGILDSMALFDTGDAKQFKDILKKRQTDYLILCPLPREDGAHEAVVNRLNESNAARFGLQALPYRMPGLPAAIKVNEASKPRIYTVN
jgi:hypothetical protein